MASLHLTIDAHTDTNQHQGEQRHQQQHDNLQHRWISARRSFLSPHFSFFQTSPNNEINFPHYDWNQSTEYNYRSTTSDGPKSMNGGNNSRYQSIRDGLDHSYHEYYSIERQSIQDAIIDELLHETKIVDFQSGKQCNRPTSPVIVFTAGVYGTITNVVWKFLLTRETPSSL